MTANVNLERFRRKRAFASWQFLPHMFRKHHSNGQLTVDDMAEFL